VELTSWSLTGLPAMPVIAVCFAHREQPRPTRQKSWYGTTNNTNMNDSPPIETATRSPRIEKTLDKQKSNAPSYLMRTASPLQTGSGAMHGRSLLSDHGQVEDFHA
jgi:hypothetical protein